VRLAAARTVSATHGPWTGRRGRFQPRRHPGPQRGGRKRPAPQETRHPAAHRCRHVRNCRRGCQDPFRPRAFPSIPAAAPWPATVPGG